jgi:hypothetical protein
MTAAKFDPEQYPESAKFYALKMDYETVTKFVHWLALHELSVCCHIDHGQMMPIDPEGLISQFFDIDLERLRAESKEMASLLALR